MASWRLVHCAQVHGSEARRCSDWKDGSSLARLTTAESATQRRLTRNPAIRRAAAVSRAHRVWTQTLSVNVKRISCGTSAGFSSASGLMTHTQ